MPEVGIGPSENGLGCSLGNNNKQLILENKLSGANQQIFKNIEGAVFQLTVEHSLLSNYKFITDI